tara:strand:- start:4843 stop:5310 length:468 start_codon:yes stop_codon:yes gene_type:complete
MIANNWEIAKKQVNDWKLSGDRIVFTNGCFDIIHRGHVEYLNEAKTYGDKLVVALNSDNSVRRLKGNSRPIQIQEDRSIIINALDSVDLVVIFDQKTPFKIINSLLPDILVKGGDYTIDTIIGAETVINDGGKVKIIPFRIGQSTSNIIKKINKL